MNLFNRPSDQHVACLCSFFASQGCFGFGIGFEMLWMVVQWFSFRENPRDAAYFVAGSAPWILVIRVVDVSHCDVQELQVQNIH